MEYTWLYAPKKRASSRIFSFFLYSGPPPEGMIYDESG